MYIKSGTFSKKKFFRKFSLTLLLLLSLFESCVKTKQTGFFLSSSVTSHKGKKGWEGEGAYILGYHETTSVKIITPKKKVGIQRNERERGGRGGR